jgi:hypothetical protein
MRYAQPVAAPQTELFAPSPLAPLERDQLVVLHGVDWKTYCAMPLLCLYLKMIFSSMNIT